MYAEYLELWQRAGFRLFIHYTHICVVLRGSLHLYVYIYIYIYIYIYK